MIFRLIFILFDMSWNVLDEKILTDWWNIDSSLPYTLDKYGVDMFYVLQDTSPLDVVTSSWQEVMMYHIAQQILLDFWDDPKFTTKLEANKVWQILWKVLSVINIDTLWALVSYNNIEEFEKKYCEKSKKTLTKKEIKRLETFMQERNVSRGMDISLSAKINADRQKMKRLLSLSFDLSILENRKAMKEFGIENTNWVFTRLFDNGIKNFQALLKTYDSLEDIRKIEWFGSKSVGFLESYMKQNNISFGMDLTPYISESQ